MDKSHAELQRKYEKLRSNCVALLRAIERYQRARRTYEHGTDSTFITEDEFHDAADKLADAETLLAIAMDEARAAL